MVFWRWSWRADCGSRDSWIGSTIPSDSMRSDQTTQGFDFLPSLPYLLAPIVTTTTASRVYSVFRYLVSLLMDLVEVKRMQHRRPHFFVLSVRDNFYASFSLPSHFGEMGTGRFRRTGEGAWDGYISFLDSLCTHLEFDFLSSCFLGLANRCESSARVPSRNHRPCVAVSTSRRNEFEKRTHFLLPPNPLEK